jgi:hypothetical protein
MRKNAPSTPVLARKAEFRFMQHEMHGVRDSFRKNNGTVLISIALEIALEKAQTKKTDRWCDAQDVP